MGAGQWLCLKRLMSRWGRETRHWRGFMPTTKHRTRWCNWAFNWRWGTKKR